MFHLKLLVCVFLLHSSLAVPTPHGSPEKAQHGETASETMQEMKPVHGVENLLKNELVQQNHEQHETGTVNEKKMPKVEEKEGSLKRGGSSNSRSSSHESQKPKHENDKSSNASEEKDSIEAKEDGLLVNFSDDLLKATANNDIKVLSKLVGKEVNSNDKEAVENLVREIKAEIGGTGEMHCPKDGNIIVESIKGIVASVKGHIVGPSNEEAKVDPNMAKHCSQWEELKAMFVNWLGFLPFAMSIEQGNNIMHLAVRPEFEEVGKVKTNQKVEHHEEKSQDSHHENEHVEKDHEQKEHEKQSEHKEKSGEKKEESKEKEEVVKEESEKIAEKHDMAKLFEAFKEIHANGHIAQEPPKLANKEFYEKVLKLTEKAKEFEKKNEEKEHGKQEQQHHEDKQKTDEQHHDEKHEENPFEELRAILENDKAQLVGYRETFKQIETAKPSLFMNALKSLGNHAMNVGSHVVSAGSNTLAWIGKKIHGEHGEHKDGHKVLQLGEEPAHEEEKKEKHEGGKAGPGEHVQVNIADHKGNSVHPLPAQRGEHHEAH